MRTAFKILWLLREKDEKSGEAGPCGEKYHEDLLVFYKPLLLFGQIDDPVSFPKHVSVDLHIDIVLLAGLYPIYKRTFQGVRQFCVCHLSVLPDRLRDESRWQPKVSYSPPDHTAD